MNHLWKEYRNTWEVFSQKLERLQALRETESAAAGSMNQWLLCEVEDARKKHTEARDRLAASLNHSAEAPEQFLKGAPETWTEADWQKAGDLVLSASR